MLGQFSIIFFTIVQMNLIETDLSLYLDVGVTE